MELLVILFLYKLYAHINIFKHIEELFIVSKFDLIISKRFGNAHFHENVCKLF